eukprot:TRINITY_DN4037_c0_g1_i2.p2 TRINITY_DN4037_c0_g1~~TRINITY_DN4037_c0_g1_i2.p2  ORF type:complete len:141 (-),score=35.33 TRINITY_DN4037_c0_g1_i2:46-468(-)
MKVKVVRKPKAGTGTDDSAAPESKRPASLAGKGTLLAQKEAAQANKAPLTKAERQARNRRLAAKFREEELRKAFGNSRDWVPKRRKVDLIPEEYRQDELEVAPTRKRISKVDSNVQKLAKRAGGKFAETMSKALSNLTSR